MQIFLINQSHSGCCIKCKSWAHISLLKVVKRVEVVCRGDQVRTWPLTNVPLHSGVVFRAHPGPRVDTEPPLTAENNEQMLGELGKKYRVPPTRATLAGAACCHVAQLAPGCWCWWWSLLVSGFTGAQTFSELAPRSAAGASASRRSSSLKLCSLKSREINQKRDSPWSAGLLTWDRKLMNCCITVRIRWASNHQHALWRVRPLTQVSHQILIYCDYCVQLRSFQRVISSFRRR